ncbi:MAG: VanZ family protein [Lachnospiraceae bacterium]|nr:VanZ family protein [Lachnospiraceae bacterium]
MKKTWIYRILVILWMLIIFLHSNMNADASSQESGVVVTFIAEHFVPGYAEMTEAEQLQVEDTLQFIVRKGAHMTEYAILGFLIAGALGIQGCGKLWLIAWLLGTAYACTDEFHQTFVPGRSGELRDVCIDSIGVLIGSGIASAIHKKNSCGNA